MKIRYKILIALISITTLPTLLAPPFAKAQTAPTQTTAEIVEELIREVTQKSAQSGGQLRLPKSIKVGGECILLMSLESGRVQREMAERFGESNETYPPTVKEQFEAELARLDNYYEQPFDYPTSSDAIVRLVDRIKYIQQYARAQI